MALRLSAGLWGISGSSRPGEGNPPRIHERLVSPVQGLSVRVCQLT